MCDKNHIVIYYQEVLKICQLMARLGLPFTVESKELDVPDLHRAPGPGSLGGSPLLGQVGDGGFKGAGREEVRMPWEHPCDPRILARFHVPPPPAIHGPAW